MNSNSEAAGDLLAASLPANRIVELRPNPHSKLRCPCGSGRPTTWQVVAHDARKVACCGSCVERVWATERLF